MAGDGLIGERVFARLERPHRTYGMDADNDYRIADLEERSWGSCFSLCYEGQKLGEIELQVHGVHNVRNAAGAAALAHGLQVDFAAINGALCQFKGVDRRYQHKGEVDGILVVDDYAHHPAELSAVIAAARQSGRRVIAVFQPHLYSRTRDFTDDFACELAAADHVVLTDIYAAREKPMPGVDSRLIEQAMRSRGCNAVDYISERKFLVPHLLELCRSGDLVLAMGAGDIDGVAGDLVAALTDKADFGG
jgi:UDP-N-acetylmuramate--alanine ligase